jgi:glycosyltransferase involved in cell wall biosynthesis
MGLILKIFRGVKVIYDCHEYRPETYSELFSEWMREYTITIVRSVERFLSKFCDSVWCVNEHLSQRFQYKDKFPVILPNYPTKDLFLNPPPLPAEVSSKYVKRKVLVYVGGITEKRGITACLYTMFFLKFFEPQAFFVFIGAVAPNYEKIIDYIITKLSLKNCVEFFGQTPHNLIPSYLALGELGIFLVQPTNRRYNWGEPIKYFEYTAAGLPVIMSDLPAKRRLIETYGNGLLVNPKDYRDTALKISRLLDDDGLRKEMTMKGIHAFKNELNWPNVEYKMIDSIRNLSCCKN